MRLVQVAACKLRSGIACSKRRACVHAPPELISSISETYRKPCVPFRIFLSISVKRKKSHDLELQKSVSASKASLDTLITSGDCCTDVHDVGLGTRHGNSKVRSQHHTAGCLLRGAVLRGFPKLKANILRVP